MISKTRIGYFADGPWAHRTLERLSNDQTIEIGFIVPRIGSTDRFLENFTKENGIPYLQGSKINSSEFQDKVKGYDCDLFISMSFDQIFRKPLIKLPPQGTINCHAGKLPFYRGRNVLNWALINDENEFGITVHYIDEGIDTGDIILQRVFPISDEDNYKTLLQRSYLECANALFETVKLIQSNSIDITKQEDIHPTGFYCGKRKVGDEVINWEQTSREVFNFIRAICDPGPKAHTSLNGEIIKINKATEIILAPKYIGICGQVVGKTNNGFLVKTKDTFIEISEVHSKLNLKIGDRLGT